MSPAPSPGARGRGGSDTRERILNRAERLFAREGVDRVTLRQIARAAGQGNVSAVQYHFGSKERLVAEILEGHQDAIDRERREQLDALEREDRLYDLPALLHVLVDPLARRLDDASGRAYLQIQARHRIPLALRPATQVMADRIARALGRRGGDPLRDRFAVLLLFGALAERASQEEARESGLPTREAFVARLTDALLGVYAGPAGEG